MALTQGMRWYGREVSAKIRKAAHDGLFEAANALLSLADSQVPHQEGVLESSGDVDCPAGSLQATVSFDTAYAVKQHEDRTLRHPSYLGKQRKAKYLEDPANEHGARLMEYVAKRIREAHG